MPASGHSASWEVGGGRGTCSVFLWNSFGAVRNLAQLCPTRGIHRRKLRSAPHVKARWQSSLEPTLRRGRGAAETGVMPASPRSPGSPAQRPGPACTQRPTAGPAPRLSLTVQERAFLVLAWPGPPLFPIFHSLPFASFLLSYYFFFQAVKSQPSRAGTDTVQEYTVGP